MYEKAAMVVVRVSVEIDARTITKSILKKKVTKKDRKNTTKRGRKKTPKRGRKKTTKKITKKVIKINFENRLIFLGLIVE